MRQARSSEKKGDTLLMTPDADTVPAGKLKSGGILSNGKSASRNDDIPLVSKLT